MLANRAFFGLCTIVPRCLVLSAGANQRHDVSFGLCEAEGKPRARATIRGLNRGQQACARNLIERLFDEIKRSRRVATRYDKFAANHLDFIKLASDFASDCAPVSPRPTPTERSILEGELMASGSRLRAVAVSPVRKTGPCHRHGEPESSAFSVAFVLGCDLIQIESEIAKMNGRTPGERLGSHFRSRHHRRRH